MLELVCATSNKHKLLEFQRASGSGVLVRGCDPRDCPETGDSFEANALQKALCYSRWADAGWLFADDSGLEVDALDGAPGILSARYAGPNSSDTANNRLLLRRLETVPRQQRTARFVCAIAGYDPLFHYPPTGKSFGQLLPAVKWEHSHRGKAYRAMLGWIHERR